MKALSVQNHLTTMNDPLCVLCVRPGKDVATNVEVFWPDGRSVARPLEPSEINTVLEIHYPRDEEEVSPTVEIQVL